MIVEERKTNFLQHRAIFDTAWIGKREIVDCVDAARDKQ